MRKLLLILCTAYCFNAEAVVFGTVSTGKQGEDKSTISKSIDSANHCQTDDQCGSAQFGCDAGYFNRNELSVSDSIKEYNTNPDYNHKCKSQTAPAAHAVCRENKCVPAS